MLELVNRVDESSREAYSLFAAWLDLDVSARASLLARVEKSQPPVHRRLLELIRADERADRLQFMADSALDDVNVEATEAASDIERSGQWMMEQGIEFVSLSPTESSIRAEATKEEVAPVD